MVPGSAPSKSTSKHLNFRGHQARAATGSPTGLVSALTNLVRDGVDTIAAPKWTGDLNAARLQQQQNQETIEEAEEPEAALDVVEQHMAPTKQSA